MGKSTTQNNNFINHFSHPHRLQLTLVTSSPPCSACKLSGGNGRIFSCRSCNFFLHETCSKMKQIITHPSHPPHLLQRRSSAPTHHTHHAGHPQHHNSFPMPNQARPRPMNRPRSIGNPSRPTGVQNVAAYRPRRQNNNLGHNGQPHLLQHNSYAPIPHSHHAGHPRHQNSHVSNQAGDRHRHVTRPGPIGNPNSATSNRPRSHNNNLGYNGQVGPTKANELIIRQERESFSQGSIYRSSYDYQTTEEFDCVEEEDEEVEEEEDEDEEESDSENDVEEEEDEEEEEEESDSENDVEEEEDEEEEESDSENDVEEEEEEEEEDFEDFDAEEEEFDGVGNW